MQKILFIDACARSDSRTRELAKALLCKLPGEIKHIDLYKTQIPELNEKSLEFRTSRCAAMDFSDTMFDCAKEFSAADIIVIAAPFWDLSFPAVLKKYIEAVSVCGLTFRYSEQGIPFGLCRAGMLYYVTTAGGYVSDYSFGFGYISTLCKTMFGIKKSELISAEGLDIFGNDAQAILSSAKSNIKI